ncbi:MAG: response regulator transcription factor [Pseudomonadota bacterium]
MRVLIIEDNVELASFMQEALLREGFLSDSAHSYHQMKMCLNDTEYAALVLDLGLPDADGIDVLHSLRKDNQMMPILIVTARGGIQDRVKGLNQGADDYLTKPFAIDELVARLRALLRRPTVLSGNTLDKGNIVLNIVSKTLLVNNKNVVLGKTELFVVEHFLRNVAITISKDALERAIYQRGYELTENAIQVAVHRVRKKLKEAGADAEIITIRGIGYLFK